ncbi:hypothetical protein L6452_16913 [Arctium lappa]|uniref:Uncharacterized protein n=1 Tax=Arctium lappa TaxID=4217 RepID=A0ACB9C1W7_ARCLA|nr:hypothetical protein L6452_16913 [Arctium lappa]
MNRQMGARVPVQQYNLRSADPYIDGASLHDLNTVDGRGGEIIEPMVDRDRDAVTDESLDNEDDSGAVECMHESYQNTLPLHSVGVEGGHSSLDTNGSSRDAYNILSADDVSPIETARARFLDFVVDNFIGSHVVEVTDSETDGISVEEKLSKRKARDIQYEGDPRFVLPLMYVANMYETLVNEVNMRLSSLDNMREKTIGVALEAAGGLYRKLAKKFPRKGACIFKRRELATSFETRSRFPELVIQEEKRVRFVVVNGLDIMEKPTVTHIDDAEWFKRLTGRNNVAVSARDYKFYAPRHKYRRSASNSVSSIPGFPTFPGADNSSPMSVAQGYRSLTESQNEQQRASKQHMQSLGQQGEFHILNQNHESMSNQYSQHNHECEIGHTQQASTMSQQMACLQPLSHLGGRLHVLFTDFSWLNVCIIIANEPCKVL